MHCFLTCSTSVGTILRRSVCPASRTILVNTIARRRDTSSSPLNRLPSLQGHKLYLKFEKKNCIYTMFKDYHPIAIFLICLETQNLIMTCKFHCYFLMNYFIVSTSSLIPWTTDVWDRLEQAIYWVIYY